MDRKSAENKNITDFEMRSNVVRLVACNGEVFELEEEAALQSPALKTAIENFGTEEPIVMPYVSRKILASMVRFCKSKLESQNLLNRSHQNNEVVSEQN